MKALGAPNSIKRQSPLAKTASEEKKNISDQSDLSANYGTRRACAQSTDSESDFYKVEKPKTARQKRAPTTAKRKTKAPTTSCGRIKRQRTNDGTFKPPRKRPEWGEASDDEELDDHIPDYIQQRRRKFDARVKQMKEIGLKLPPSYNDVEFSDDDRLAHLAEKPHFEKGKPVTSYKDVTLPKSLGIIPAPIAQWLRDYQVDGTAFLHTLFVYQTGGILGDDMGL